jgi:hypothetical protein
MALFDEEINWNKIDRERREINNKKIILTYARPT